ncbi:MAG: DNA primase [Desulfuromonadales bacterium]|nr:DNA primase [Desulfuromonadales bacterium]
MTGRIAEDKIQEIRERTDIVEIVSSYLPLRRAGANHLGLCPFHAEKTPSFNVNAARQIFHCFGCGVGGNVFSFLMRLEGLSFPDAVRRLGEKVGIEVEEEAPSAEELQQRQEQEQLARVTEVACEFYHRTLLEEKEGAPGRRYLRQRGYDGEIARQFRLGFAPDRWEALAGHLAAKGFDPRWARELGLIRPREGRGDFDLFRRRLLFPIIDLQGRVAAFGGRVLDDGLPKYLNSSESRLYHKGRLLFGLYQAREAMRRGGEGIVVEGYFDQLALHRAGFPQTVATCGTALTPEHGRLLKRYCERLLLLFDQDEAGRRATFRAMDVLLAEGVAAAVVTLDPGDDPDSFLRRCGAEEMRRRLGAARPVMEVFIEQTLAEHGEEIEGRARAVQEILPRLRRLPDEIERNLYLRALSERTGVELAVLRRQGSASETAAVSATRAVSPSQGRAPAAPPARRGAGAGMKSQLWLLQLMVADPQIHQRVAREGVARFFFSPDHRHLAELLLRLGDVEQLPGALHSDALSEEQKALLSGILVKDENKFADHPEQVVEGCLQAVEKERLKQRIAELDLLIRRAEQEEDQSRHSAYQAERIQINRKLKSRDGQI